jgi:very-short-patch-repair endonuclease
MFLTFGLGDDTKYHKQHYENTKRFNVATSRAKYFTYAVIGKIPDNATLLKDYFLNFGLSITTENIDTNIELVNSDFNFHEFRNDLIESDFERKVSDELKIYVKERNLNGAELTLHNQITVCGGKRLDFVIYNRANGKSIAVEVDGPCHYVENTDNLCEEHIKRIEVLKRAGWVILHIEYKDWYKRGWLCDDDGFIKTREKLYSDLDKLL